MHKIILGFCLCITGAVFGQEVKPSVWEVKFSRDKVAKNDTVTIYFIGNIPEHQGVYATKYNCDYGPMPTKLVFTNSGNDYIVLDSAVSVGDSADFDPIFECNLRKFKKVATIKQVVRLKHPKVEIKGQLEYQTCTEDMCLQYRVYFETKGTKVLKVENGK